MSAAAAVVAVAVLGALPSLADALVTAASHVRRGEAPLARLLRLQRRLRHDAEQHPPVDFSTPPSAPLLRTMAELNVSLRDACVLYRSEDSGLVSLVLRGVSMELPPGVCAGALFRPLLRSGFVNACHV